VGTSADRASGSGGAWTPLKHAASAYAKAAACGSGGTRGTAERVLGRHVEVLGGPAGAAAGARAGRTGMAGLGGVLSGIGNAGLVAALVANGLGNLVGKDRFDVLEGLITLVAGDASDLESQAARDAVCDVLDDLFADADTWEELEATAVSTEALQEMLTTFLSHYVYNRLPVLAEKLARFMDPAAARDADRQVVEMIRALVTLRMPDDPIRFDWQGPAGQRFADDAVREVYGIIAELGKDTT